MIEDKKVVKTESVLETLLLDMSNQMNRTRDLSYEILTKSNPSLAIVIGDTVYDINAAHENNLPCIGVKYGYGKNEDILKTDFIANNPEEIVSHIKRLSAFALKRRSNIVIDKTDYTRPSIKSNEGQ